MSESPDFGSAGLSDAAGALEDAKAFNKGKGRLLAGMIALGLALLAVFAWYLVEDQPNPYGELGKQVNRLRTASFETYWTCALPGSRPSDIKSDTDLREQLHARGEKGTRYATHLRDKCGAQLRDLAVQLRSLLPPEDAAPLVKRMADAVAKLEVGTRAYSTYLEELEGAYSRTAAEPEIESLVRGWYEFKAAHVELNKLVKAKLGR
jgi:hypothetical protein